MNNLVSTKIRLYIIVQSIQDELITLSLQLALGAQLGLESELVDWYRDVTSVPNGHLLIDMSKTKGRSIDYVFEQTLDLFPRKNISSNDWNL